MGLGEQASRVIGFFRAGYPKGAPPFGYAPLLALLPRRVSDDEVTTIVRKLFAPKRRSIDKFDVGVDVGVEITRVTDEMPSTDDVERVQRRLEAMKSN